MLDEEKASNQQQQDDCDTSQARGASLRHVIAEVSSRQ